jgi:uncharacterized membrane-anchored protein
MRPLVASCAAVLLLFSSPLSAQAPQTAEDTARLVAAYRDSMRAIEAGLRWQTGRVELRDGLAAVALPEGYRYLDPAQTEKVLSGIWGNPPGIATLGMIFPANVGPTNDDSWGVVLTYDEDGYVKDDDAAKIDYPKLLRDMQEDVRKGNAERVRRGYQAIQLVGWAAAPHYDSAAHKLYWARELSSDAQGEHTLNYDVRVLGRRGILSMNAISSMRQLPEVEQHMADVMGFVDFKEGHRYADFRPGVDKVAAYGIAALVAGKVAAKVGLFKLILAFLVAAKKAVVMAFVAVAAWLRRLFGRKREEQSATSA